MDRKNYTGHLLLQCSKLFRLVADRAEINIRTITMRKVFCFGELLLRLSPEAGGGWIKNASMPVYIGGSELNVATALAKWNVPVAYCTSLPDNFLSQEIITELTHRSIDVSPILISGNRIGCFYLPQGADLKH